MIVVGSLHYRKKGYMFSTCMKVRELYSIYYCKNYMPLIYLIVLAYNHTKAEFMCLQVLLHISRSCSETCMMVRIQLSMCAWSPRDSENARLINLQSHTGSSEGIHPLWGSSSFIFNFLGITEHILVSSQLAFYVNLHRAVIGPSATARGNLGKSGRVLLKLATSRISLLFSSINDNY